MERQQRAQQTSEGGKAGHTEEVGSIPEAALQETNSMDRTGLLVVISALRVVFSFRRIY